MKYLILSTSGKQTVIKPNQWYDINFIKGAEKGDFLVFSRVFLYRDDRGAQIGKPLLYSGSLIGEVVQHIKGKKLLVLKTKPKKNYTRTLGHRNKYTRVQFSTF
jgi:large subunit ribosomal protein L21